MLELNFTLYIYPKNSYGRLALVNLLRYNTNLKTAKRIESCEDTTIALNANALDLLLDSAVTLATNLRSPHYQSRIKRFFKVEEN